MIKSSSHSLKFTNTGKKDNYINFYNEMFDVFGHLVDYVWNTYAIHHQSIPKYISSAIVNNILPNHNLSARAIKCLTDQACGFVKAVTRKNEKIRWYNNKHGTNYKEKKISKPKPKYGMGFELNSICATLYNSDTEEFDHIMVLSSIGKIYGKIYLPIKNHRHSNKLKDQSISKKPMTSFLFRPDYVDIRYELPTPKKKPLKTSKIIGADQGVKKAVVLSDGQMTTKCPHGHDLHSIMKEMEKTKPDTKAYKRLQDKRTNYINWAINQLNFDDIGTLRLEKLKNVRKGQPTSKFLSRFTYTTIRNKLIDTCLSNGVRFEEMPNRYRSQRCHDCGFVHTKNRKKENFTCLACGYEDDADLNAAKNNSIVLFDIPWSFYGEKHNHKTGFHWFVDTVSICSEFPVPIARKSKRKP